VGFCSTLPWRPTRSACKRTSSPKEASTPFGTLRDRRRIEGLPSAIVQVGRSGRDSPHCAGHVAPWQPDAGMPDRDAGGARDREIRCGGPASRVRIRNAKFRTRRQSHICEMPYRAVLSGFHIELCIRNLCSRWLHCCGALRRGQIVQRACWESGARSAATFCAAR
jgi:hypothetical protein